MSAISSGTFAYTYTSRIIMGLISVIIALILSLEQLYSQEESPNINAGVAISIDAPSGDKGVVLPKIELKALDQYSPISGQNREGLIIENMTVDRAKGLDRGIYMWINGKWNKLLSYTDLPKIPEATKVYTGQEDPNNASSPDLASALEGSLYINTKKKIILKKGSKSWTEELEIPAGGNYIGSTTISIHEDSNGNKLEAVAGMGLKITDTGIAASIDGTNLAINAHGISAKSGEALWNANKLQGAALKITTPSEGQVLQYKDSKWVNSSSQYTGGQGIDITNDTINAKSGEALWNANKLVGRNLDISSPPKDGQAIIYDENADTWKASDVKGMPDGTSDGQVPVWQGSTWIPQTTEKVDIKGDNIYLSGLPKEGASQNITNNSMLMINENGKLSRWSGTAWDTKGNNNLALGDQTLGFSDKNSKANMVFKTSNTARLRIESGGNIEFKTTNTYFTGIKNEEQDQINGAKVLLLEKNGRLTKWKGNLVGGNRAGHNPPNMPITDSADIFLKSYTSDWVSYPDKAIDIVGQDGEIKIHIVHTDNVSGSVKERYITKVIKIGYENTKNTAGLPPINVYTYDITDNNKGIKFTDRQTDPIDLLKNVMIYFTIEKISGQYKLVPYIWKTQGIIGNISAVLLRSTVIPYH